MLVTYQGIIHNDKDGLWLEFPALPGCFSHAKNIPELLQSGKEAMETWVLGILENGEKLPQERLDLERTLGEGESFTYIQSDIDLANNAKSVEKTLTIPAWLDEQATLRHLNYSKVLQDALVANL